MVDCGKCKLIDKTTNHLIRASPTHEKINHVIINPKESLPNEIKTLLNNYSSLTNILILLLHLLFSLTKGLPQRGFIYRGAIEG